MATPTPRHHCRYPIDCPGGHVYPRNVLKRLGRKDPVAVAKHQRVNVGHLREVIDRVLCHCLVGFTAQARVGNGYDHIGTLFLHFWHEFAGSGRNIISDHFAG